MAETDEDGSNWLIELGLMEDLPALEPNAQWPSNAFSLPNNIRFLSYGVYFLFQPEF